MNLNLFSENVDTSTVKQEQLALIAFIGATSVRRTRIFFVEYACVTNLKKDSYLLFNRFKHKISFL